MPCTQIYYSECFTEGSEDAAERSERIAEVSEDTAERSKRTAEGSGGATGGQKSVAEGGERIAEALLSPPVPGGPEVLRL